LVNEEAWKITLRKLKLLKRKTSFWVIKETYFDSLRLYLEPRLKNYKEKRTKIEAINEHLSSVKFLYEQEKKRQDNIDSKAKQILSNSGIILTIFGALSSYVISGNFVSYHSYNLYGSIAVLVLLISSLVIAIYVLDFKKYSRPTIDLVFNSRNSLTETFLRERIISFIKPIEFNIATNTDKTKKIKISTFLFGLALLIATMLLCLNLFLVSGSSVKVSVQDVNITNESIKIDNPCCDSNGTVNSKIVDYGSIYFEFDKANLTVLSMNKLNDIVLELEEYPKSKIYLSGHSDYLGSDKYNLNLSMERTKAVKDYLITHGINENRIVFDFYGEKLSIDNHKEVVATGINRRVEWILK